MTAPEPQAKTGGTVLFVDDDVMVCRSMGRCLERAGFQVTTVTSAEEALAKARGHRFEAIVTDHNMPTMTGGELIDKLLALDPTLRGRIILTSGDLHTEANESLLKRTGTRGLQKPFQLAELSLAVRAAVAKAATLTAA
ncbi:MAG: response regulator [Gemmatimonadales bacterium]|nr:response regulator [Gemmatimonadales bacterium]